MCGIVGIIASTQHSIRNHAEAMTKVIAHRGPDSSGVFVNPTGHTAFGHCRLAIVDLSAGGHQPMSTPDGRFTITFNGEIYNYIELKNELSKLGWQFRSNSDTEVLLYAFAQWGIEGVKKIEGMFAFGIWDEKEKKLTLVRDRLGEKPLKYYADNHVFLFSSELKAILTYPGIQKEIDWNAIDLALSYRFVPAPKTGFKNIYKLSAGHYLEYHEGKITVAPYWQASDFTILNTTRTREEWKEELWSVFYDSVKKRMMSDVPVGAFLSGGLDSSSVVAAMSTLSSNPVKTFSVGFKHTQDSEHEYARMVAKRFSTDHTEIVIDPKAIEWLSPMVWQYEEPFFDNSAVPMLAMAQETKKHATVVLTGDGADECLGGYPAYWFFKYVSTYHTLPAFLTHHAVPGLARLASHVIPSAKLQKAAYRAELLGHGAYGAYADYYAIWQEEFKKTKFYATKDDLYTQAMKSRIQQGQATDMLKKWMTNGTSKSYGPMNQAMFADVVGRIPDGYLYKVDIAAMTYAVETRPPFLDHRFVELCLQMPEGLKMEGKNPKVLWKEIMAGTLPEEICKRRKQGFGIPITAWMKHELYEFTRERLLGQSVFQDVFHDTTIERILTDHKHGKADYSNHLWSLLVLREWMRQFYGK